MRDTHDRNDGCSSCSGDAQPMDPARRTLLKAGLGSGLGMLLSGFATNSLFADDEKPSGDGMDGAGMDGDGMDGMEGKAPEGGLLQKVKKGSTKTKSDLPGFGETKSVILLWLAGGPSHIDTFDPKPGAKTGGPFQAIPTSVPGLHISEHLPRIAEQAKHACIVRSMTSKEGNHERAAYLWRTGYSMQNAVLHPAWGSVVSATLADEESDLPSFVTVGGPGERSGYLGAAHNAFPVANPNQMPANASYFRGVDAKRFGRRRAMLGLFDGRFTAGRDDEPVRGQHKLQERASRFLTSPRRAVFDLNKEKATVRDSYGRNNFGQGCLLARRLVEEGVRFSQVTLGGWDTHQRGFPAVQARSQILDAGVGSLLADLAERDLLDQTLVLCLGEFGRTPNINKDEGRDHYPKASSLLLAGGRTPRGAVVGSTDAMGGEVQDVPIGPQDLYVTVCHHLGLDPREEFLTPEGRPMKIVDGGTRIPELIA